jgi:hypothetical protein
MTKIRLIVSVLTIIVVGTIGTMVFLYAKGYRFDPQDNSFSPKGLLVIKSAPDGAQIYINGDLDTATNATISLDPGTYDVHVQKEGYLPWDKRLTIKKEEVTESTAHLFKSVPSLSAVTFAGSINPTPSRDYTKIAYAVPPGQNGSDDDTGGLWVMEMLNLPLGFARDPKKITDGDLTNATWTWSPDGREILLKTSRGIYLLDAGQFTPQAQMVNIASKEQETLAEWGDERQTRLKAQVRKLPDEMESILERKARSVVLSPDEDMILYTASGSATIPDNLIKPVPGASTQEQVREISEGKTYVYDIKEDRNFLIDENGNNLTIEGGFQTTKKRRLSWFPTSRHLILAEENQITIMDYDNTNRKTVYAGSYVYPDAFSTLSIDRIIILTNLGADDSTPPNLYSVSIK